MLYETTKRLDLRQTRSLATLMELYEYNYARLVKLIPNIRGIEDAAVSRVPGSPELHLQVRERGPFTTTLCLTYFFAAEDGNSVADPDLQVRVYHDAKLAEAMASRYRPGLGAMPAGCALKLPVLDWKWELNLFLDKWLSYCLAQGHRFPHRDGRALNEGGPVILAGT